MLRETKTKQKTKNHREFTHTQKLGLFMLFAALGKCLNPFSRAMNILTLKRPAEASYAFTQLMVVMGQTNLPANVCFVWHNAL